VARMQKAAAVMQFKLEGQAIDRHPEWQMDHRRLLHRIDCEAGTIASVSEPSTAARVRIQYGVSVKPENAGEFLRQDDIDGALVGGACLNPRVFAQIVHRAAAASVYTAPTK